MVRVTDCHCFIFVVVASSQACPEDNTGPEAGGWQLRQGTDSLGDHIVPELQWRFGFPARNPLK